MTIKPSKHGLRAMAAAKRNLHAQRTPLPPQPGRVEDAEETIANTRPPRGSGLVSRNGRIETIRYGQMTVTELRPVAFRLGVDKHRSMSKGELLNAILAAEDARERVAEAKVDITLSSGRTARTDQIDSAFDTPTQAASGTPSKSQVKFLRLADAAKDSGWTADSSLEGDSTVASTFRRGPEAISITWDNGVFRYETASYAVGDRVVRIRNVAHAKQLMGRSEDAAKQEVKRVESNRKFRKVSAVEGPTKSKVRFNPGLLSDAELIDQLLGKGITWTNNISGKLESAYVGRNPRNVRVVYASDGERAVQFCCPITGFRAFRVSSLRKVGVKVDLRTREPKPDAKVRRPRKANQEKVQDSED